METKLKAYIAGPLGFSEAGRLFYYEKFLPFIESCGLEVLDPWHMKADTIIKKDRTLPAGRPGQETWKERNLAIGEKNDKDIKECDLVIANLDGADVDSGTAAEIGYATALGKPIFGYRGDFRQAGDNEASVVNLQVEHFIYKNGGVIVETYKDLQVPLEEFCKKRKP